MITRTIGIVLASPNMSSDDSSGEEPFAAPGLGAGRVEYLKVCIMLEHITGIF